MLPDSITTSNRIPSNLQPILDSYWLNGFTNYVGVLSMRINNSYPMLSFGLQFNNTIGSYPLASLIYMPMADSVKLRTPLTSTVNITNLGTPGIGFIEGNFICEIILSANILPKIFTCNFKVPRPL